MRTTNLTVSAIRPSRYGFRLFDYSTIDALRQNHPAWRLLRSDHAPLVASFLHRVFTAPNVRVISQADLAEALEDELYALREQLGTAAFPKAASDYLTDWSANDKGWLRKFYRQDSDEPHFDLTPATEKAIAWLATLTVRSFVGTESRLLRVFPTGIRNHPWPPVGFVLLTQQLLGFVYVLHWDASSE